MRGSVGSRRRCCGARGETSLSRSRSVERPCTLRAGSSASVTRQQGLKWAGTGRYGVPADAISMPADSASEIVKFTISTPRESCTNAMAKYSSSVVPPDPSVHFYHCPPMNTWTISTEHYSSSSNQNGANLCRKCAKIRLAALADLGIFRGGGDFGNPSERISERALGVWAYWRMKFERL